MKKIYAILTAMIMLLQSVAICAAEDEAGWTVGLKGSVNTDDSKYFAMRSTEASQEYRYDGDDALFVKYPGSTKTDTEYLTVTNVMNASTVAGEEYTLTFYIKGAKNSPYQEILLGDEVLTTFKAISGSMTKMTSAPSGQTNWYEAIYTFTAKSAENKLSFRFYGGTSSAAIDNVSLVKVGTENDLVENGGFEDAFSEAEGEPDAEFDQTPYTPQAIMASANESTVILNWTNPSSDKLTRISVYDITDGEETLLADDLDTTKSKAVFYKVSGLTMGENYQFKVVFSFSDKGDFVYYLCGSPSSASSADYGAWGLNWVKIGDAGYCPAEINIDSEVSHSGKASIHMKSNIDRTNHTEFVSNIYTAPNTNVDMEIGKTYQVSFWAKGENVTGKPEVHVTWVSFDGRPNNIYTELCGTYDWKKFTNTYTYKESGKNNLRFCIADPTGDLWIDDVEVYELGADGKVVPDAVNLVTNGDIEGLTNDKAGEITGLSATAEVGAINLSWNAPSDNYQKAEIYEKYFDKYLYRGTIAKNAESIKLSNLKNGAEYTYRLVPVNADNVKGEPVEVTATVEMPNYETGEVILKKSGTTVKRLSGEGKYTVSFSVKNNLFEDGMPVEQFVAVYDESNVLYKVFSTQKTIKKTGVNKAYSTISTAFDIPGDNYTAEFFVFDGRNTLNIVGEPNPHKVFTE